MTKVYAAQGTLSPCAPFDFDKTLDFIGEFAPMVGEQTLAPRSLTKTISLDGDAVVFQLTARGEIEKPALAYTLYSARKLNDKQQERVLNQVRFFLSLDDDLKPFYQIGKRDEKFAPVIKRFYGLHHVKFLTPFENAIWAILTQRQPMRVAHKTKLALVEKYGARLEVNGQTYRAFPEAGQLLNVSAEDLNALVKNERKAQYLRAVIDAFANVPENFLYDAPTEQVREWLLNIKGIGAWSADFILLRGLGRMEAMRMTEYNMRGDPFGEAIAQVYNDGKKVSDAERERLAKQYGAWQGYWAYYLRVNGRA